MSKMQRTKGASFEREVCAELTGVLGSVVRRNLSQTRGGATEGSDITVGKFSIECKRRARISVYDWLDQATRDAQQNTPVVVARADGRKSFAIMWLDDLLPMLQGEIVGAEATRTAQEPTKEGW